MPAPDQAEVSRSERQLNRGWAEANPELFTRYVFDFFTAYPATEWRHHIDLHRGKGQVVFIANRREEPFVAERDYLIEIGMK